MVDLVEFSNEGGTLLTDMNQGRLVFISHPLSGDYWEKMLVGKGRNPTLVQHTSSKDVPIDN